MASATAPADSKTPLMSVWLTELLHLLRGLPLVDVDDLVQVQVGVLLASPVEVDHALPQVTGEGPLDPPPQLVEVICSRSYAS